MCMGIYWDIGFRVLGPIMRYLGFRVIVLVVQVWGRYMNNMLIEYLEL